MTFSKIRYSICKSHLCNLFKLKCPKIFGIFFQALNLELYLIEPSASFFGCKGSKIALKTPDGKFIRALSDKRGVKADGTSRDVEDSDGLKLAEFEVSELEQSATLDQNKKMIALKSAYEKYVVAYSHGFVNAAMTRLWPGFDGGRFEVERNDNNQYWFKLALKDQRSNEEMYLVPGENGSLDVSTNKIPFTPECI